MVEYNMTKILLIEDNESDAFMFRRQIQETEKRYFKMPEYEIVHVERLEDGISAIRKGDIDITFLDLNLPDSKGDETIATISDYLNICAVVILSGLADEEFALQTVKLGVQDYILKEDLTPNNLYRVIRYSLERFHILSEKEMLIHKLEVSLDQIKKLEGLLPICSNCKKIRVDEIEWEEIDIYMRDHSDFQFTHSLCPECAKKIYPNIFDD